MQGKCKDCKWCEQKFELTPKGPVNDLHCKRYPPNSVSIVTATPKGPQILGEVTHFAKVQADWWCGEWQQGVLKAENLNLPGVVGRA